VAQVDSNLLDSVVRRIVEAVQPERIVLFGSAARGEVGPNSDLDFLVVKEGVNRLETMDLIHRNLRGIPAAIDVVVVTPQDVVRYGQSRALVIAAALREGKVVYAA